MFTAWPNIAMAILAMLTLVLLACPLALQEKYVRGMELCVIRESVESRNLY
jgi:hypothetical protein